MRSSVLLRNEAPSLRSQAGDKSAGGASVLAPDGHAGGPVEVAVASAVVAKQIREWRVKRALTQGQLASLVGCSQAAVSNYERGLRELTVSQALLLACALDITLAELTGTAEVIFLRQS